MTPKKVTDAVGPASAAKILVDKSKKMGVLAKRMEKAANALAMPEKVKEFLVRADKLVFLKGDGRIGTVDIGYLNSDSDLLPPERRSYYVNTITDLLLEFTKELIAVQYDELRRLGGDL